MMKQSESAASTQDILSVYVRRTIVQSHNASCRYTTQHDFAVRCPPKQEHISCQLITANFERILTLTAACEVMQGWMVGASTIDTDANDIHLGMPKVWHRPSSVKKLANILLLFRNPYCGYEHCRQYLVLDRTDREYCQHTYLDTAQ